MIFVYSPSYRGVQLSRLWRWLRVAEPWLSADDIAAHLGVTKDTVYAWVGDRAMPAHKIGRLWKFQASEVDAWVRRGGAAVVDSDSD